MSPLSSLTYAITLLQLFFDLPLPLSTAEWSSQSIFTTMIKESLITTCYTFYIAFRAHHGDTTRPFSFSCTFCLSWRALLLQCFWSTWIVPQLLFLPLQHHIFKKLSLNNQFLTLWPMIPHFRAPTLSYICGLDLIKLRFLQSQFMSLPKVSSPVAATQ